MDPGSNENSTQKRRRLDCPSDGAGDMIPVDRISSLPESIISHILSLIPTKSAVATSFLSKSWRLRWTKVTAFDFDDILWPNCERSVPETRGAVVAAMNFVEFVNLVLAYHTESIHKLRLQWQSCNLRSVSLNIWLNVAIARNFRVLDLGADWWGLHIDVNYEFKLPVGIYTCGTLETVKLRGPFRIDLPHAVRLPKLTDLELIGVSFESDDSFEKLISACPVLHSFIIKRYRHNHDLLVCKVSSPSLKHLHFFDQHRISNDMKLLIDTPALEHLVVDSVQFSEITCLQRVMPMNELEINAVCESNLPRGDGVAGLIHACGDGVKVLQLWESAMVALGCSATPLPATFGRLTKLVVDIHRSHWSNLLDLIDRCINLQVLEFAVLDIDNLDDADRVLESLGGGSYWRPPIRVPVCLSSSLKRVYFGFFTGLDDEMAMLKFLLDHGLLIERVKLCTRYTRRISDTQKLKILNEVLMLSRAKFRHQYLVENLQLLESTLMFSTNCKMSFS